MGVTRAVSQRAVGNRRLRDVWAWNFDAEFDELLAAANRGVTSVLALDVEFPGWLCEDPPFAVRTIRYWALRENVDILRPIQIGLAVADIGGVLHGAWNFNLWFDLTTSVHTEESVRFLSAAGVDFPRHAVEGIDPSMLAWRLTSSTLVGHHDFSPRWVTFSGWYDWGYWLKLVTGQPMPKDVAAFDELLASLCPFRFELRDVLLRGSLDTLMAAHKVERRGCAHTAGSDALATLELFFCVFNVEHAGDDEEEADSDHSASSTATRATETLPATNPQPEVSTSPEGEGEAEKEVVAPAPCPARRADSNATWQRLAKSVSWMSGLGTTWKSALSSLFRCTDARARWWRVRWRFPAFPDCRRREQEEHGVYADTTEALLLLSLQPLKFCAQTVHSVEFRSLSLAILIFSIFVFQCCYLLF